MLCLKDEYSGYAWVYFLRKKKEAATRIRSFFAFVERQYEVTVKGFRSDRGGEFLHHDFVQWLEELGVTHQLTTPYTPQQNGMCERYNRTLCDRARAMLSAAGLPQRYWEDALRYANWVSNRLPTTHLPKNGPGSPFEALTGRKPDVSFAKVFGCLAHVWVPDEPRLRKKFDPRAELGVFLGVAEDSKGWEFWIPATHTVGRISRNAIFHESKFYRDYSDLARVAGPDPESYVDPFPPGLQLSESRSLPEQSESDQPDLSRRPVADFELYQEDSEAPLPGRVPGEGEISAEAPTQRRDRRVGFHLGPSDPQGEGEREPLRSPPAETVVEPDPGDAALPVVDPGSPDPSESLPVLQEQGEQPSQGESESSSESGESRVGSRELAGDSSPGRASTPPTVVVLREATPRQEARPVRARQPPLRFSPRFSGSHVYKRAGSAAAFLASQPPQRWTVPRSIAEANKSEEADRWYEARTKELQGLEDMGAWELVDPPAGANILRSLWAFALKLNPDNTIERFKARLVIDGSQQKAGIDFEDTFASTAGRTTVRTFFAVSVALGWVVHQLDVSQAFLYGQIDKEVYMYQPPGHRDGTGRVCRLRRSLYGLKQAPRIWSEHLRKTLQDMGFIASVMDPSLYVWCKEGIYVFLLDWVDDILVGSSDPTLIQLVKDGLSARYKMTDLGVVQKYIGMSVYWDREEHSCYLHQAYYCLELLEKFGLVGRKFPDTPLPADFVLFHPWESLSPDGDREPPAELSGLEESPLDTAGRLRYQRIVGSLNYAAHVTRLDIAYAVSQLSRVCQKPRQRHLEAAERCTLYLGGTADWGIRYSRDECCYFLEAYCDANLSPHGETSNMTGMILQLGGGPVSWMAKKQERKSSSTTDSEALAVMTTAQHVVHMRDLLAVFGCTQGWPTPLYNDNTACVAISTEPRAHHRSIQLTRPMGMVRELVHDGYLEPKYMSTSSMPADFLTKRLAREQFEKCRGMAGLTPLPPHVVSLSTAPAAEQGGV
jgi:hypothetical protein